MLKINSIEFKPVHVFTNPVRKSHTRVWVTDNIGCSTGYYEVENKNLLSSLKICSSQFEVTTI